MDVDIVVVGAGAAGLGAAAAARRRGASVALVERDRLGGDCTWVGCVPSKALIERAREVWGGRRRGLTGEVDFAAIMREVGDARAEVGEDESRPALEAQGIQVLQGQAAFTAALTLNVDGTPVRAAKAVIVATGSRPIVPPVDGLAEAQPLTNETVFELRTLPARMAVLGGGPIGLELGQAFNRLGSAVTLLDRGRIAAKEEPEASEVIAQVLTAEGVQLLSDTTVQRVTSAGGAHTLRLDGGGTVEADTILVAAGRRAVTDGLDAQRAGIRTDDRGFITVDDRLRTSADGVYAIGDVAGRLQFTHAGYEMGAVAWTTSSAGCRAASTAERSPGPRSPSPRSAASA